MNSGIISTGFTCPNEASMMSYGGGMMGSGWGYLGLIFMVLFWAAVILLIIWLYKQIRGPEASGTSNSALDVLKERYAKGEIKKDEFQEMKKELEE